MSAPLTVANLVMAALFLVSAALQYNDPDPLGWIAIYVAAAVACVQLGRHERSWVVPLLVLVAAVAWIGTLAPGVVREVAPDDLFKSMDDKGGSAELARECGGLAIVAAWMALIALTSRRAARRGR
jgi:hypothetical protein